MRVAASLVANLATIMLLGASSSASPDHRQDAPSTASWSVAPPYGTRAGADSALQCVGFFDRPRTEHDGTGERIFFGGRQRCDRPVTQTVEVYLRRRIGADWVTVARVRRSGAGFVTQATGGSPYCDASSPNAYRLEVYAAAEGIAADPWPATSEAYVFGCRIIPF